MVILKNMFFKIFCLIYVIPALPNESLFTVGTLSQGDLLLNFNSLCYVIFSDLCLFLFQ